MRVKFRVTSVQPLGEHLESVHMTVVTDPPMALGGVEGHMELTISNPSLTGAFKKDKNYDIEFLLSKS